MTPTLADAQDALAAMEVACSRCKGCGSGYPGGVAFPVVWEECSPCQGTGTRPRFPAMRAACRADHDETGCTGLRYAEWSGISFTSDWCDQRGYVPNRDWDAVREVAREAGWVISTVAHPTKGTSITIFQAADNIHDEIILGAVRYSDLIRDQHAETVALWRAAREGCHAQRDGDCFWRDCPQTRDNEPARSGRHCPLETEAQDAGD